MFHFVEENVQIVKEEKLEPASRKQTVLRAKKICKDY